MLNFSVFFFLYPPPFFLLTFSPHCVINIIVNIFKLKKTHCIQEKRKEKEKLSSAHTTAACFPQGKTAQISHALHWDKKDI